jgi:beta-phosphoglucomutase
MSIKAFIFDLDGVIVDTAKFHYLAWRDLARSLGHDFSVEDNEKLKGVSRMQSLEILLQTIGVRASEEQKKQMAEWKNNRYRELVRSLTPADILPGVMDFMLEARNQCGLKLALASASKNTPLILERIGLTDFFDAVVDGNMVTKAKPEPDIFLTAARMLNVSASECIVFEDAVAGIEAAHRAGMRAVGVGDRAVLTEADMVISSFENLRCKSILEF